MNGSLFRQGLPAWMSLLLLAGTVSTAAPAQEKPPNIILILADDLGYGDIGAFNPQSKIPTPHIDRLAAEGIRLTRAYTPSSVCTPTRYGLLTGRYAWRTILKRGVLLGFSPPLIEPERPTLASLLKSRGYATAVVGKWHLGLNWSWKDGSRPAKPRSEDVDFTGPVSGGPNELGFDHSYIFPIALDFPPFCFVENGRTVGNPSVSIMQEAQRLPPRYREQYEGLTVPGWKNSEVGPIITRQAVSWIRRQHRDNPDQPFFLYLPTSAPHVPYAPPDFVAGISQAGRRGDMCAEVDWTVGQVLSVLDELELTGSTLVIFSSDNGAIVGDRKEGVDGIGPEHLYDTYGHQANGPFRGQKWTIYDGGFRVPLVARWPDRIPPGSRSDQLFSLIDLFATLSAATGTQLPAGAGPDSFDMLAVLLGATPQGALRNSVVLHSQMGLYAIREGRWKLILGHGGGTWYDEGRPAQAGETPGRLFDLESDPAESQNLWDRHPDVVARLQKLLEQVQTNETTPPSPP